MLLNITACALAIAVPLLGVVVSLIYARNVQSKLEAQLYANCSQITGTLTTSCAQLNASIAQITDRLHSCESGLRQTSGTHLSQELAALAGDVDALSKTVRKNFGRVWAELHHEGVLKRAAGKQGDLASGDSEIDELLALQSAPSPRPNGDGR